MSEPPPPPKKGDPLPDAAWYQADYEYKASLRLDVSDGGELEIEQLAGGSTLHFARYNCHKLATVTEEIPAASDDDTPGKGKVVLRPFNGATKGTGAEVDAYCESDVAVPVDAKVWVGLTDGYWFVVSRFDCESGA